MKFDQNFARPVVFKRPLATHENDFSQFLAKNKLWFTSGREVRGIYQYTFVLLKKIKVSQKHTGNLNYCKIVTV